MSRDDQTFAYAFFRDERAAAVAVRKLIHADFDSEHIGVVMRSASDVAEVPLEHNSGVGPGAFLGGVLGVAAGAAALPGTGIIALGGAFATVGGAAIGGAAGTLLGALGGLGLWKGSMAAPHAAFERGGVLVGTLTPAERAQSARCALQAAGAAETKLATPAQAKADLRATEPVAAPRPGASVNPDRLARNVFLLMLAYVAAVGGAIWLFIGPV